MKPQILVMSNDYDPDFEWLSNRDTWEDFDALMKKAHEAIGRGKSVPETIHLLEVAGFEVFRWDETKIERIQK